MVEKVAEAIGKTKASILMPWEFQPEEHKARCRIEARAAIEALVEPTPAVVQTGAAEIRKFDRERDSSDEGAVSVFRAMLRTALSQPNEEGEGK